MTGNHRQWIFDRLAEALKAAPPAAPERPEPRPLSPDPADDPWPGLEAAVREVAGEFHLVKSAEEALELAAQLCDRHRAAPDTAPRAALWDCPLFDDLGLDRGLTERGVATILPHLSEDAKAATAACDLGFTGADAVLADSGCVVVRARSATPRSVSLLPPVHVAFVNRRDLIAGLDSLPGTIKAMADEQGLLPSGIHLITGPSRTADIELVLILGVHGPKTVHVVGLDFDPSGD